MSTSVTSPCDLATNQSETCAEALPKTVSLILPLKTPPWESKGLFYTSLLLSHKQGYHYHLSKFHIYALSCIGVFLSGLFHSV